MSRTKRLWLGTLVVAFLELMLVCNSGKAQVTLRPGTVMRVEGQRGVWWPDDTALRLVDEHRELSLSKELLAEKVLLIDTQDKQLALRWDRIQNLLAALDEEKTRAGIAEAGWDVALEGKAQAEEDLHAWWRNPTLWFVSGFVLAGAGVTAGVILAN